RSACSTEEAVTWLAELGADGCVLAGGTDVMMQYARHELGPAAFVHIERIEELAGVGRDGVVRIGALVTHRRLAEDAALRTSNPALADAAATVGGWQTQSVGTLGGNLCNGSPAADSAPPLLVADATVELQSRAGIRRVPLEEFFLGRRRVDRRPEELLTAVEVEPLGSRQAEVYLKVGRRGAMVVAVVGLAARLSFDARGAIAAARVALCSAAPTPLRVRSVEQALVGLDAALPGWQDATSPSLRDGIDALMHAVSPIGDLRSSEAYRRAVLPGLLARAIEICRARAGVGVPEG
ncbi:MAG: FAD binding domain-containing protein, partial [Actinomycetota bacterium]|nr:FAD binding domain-containing protein [Actinomycetota bacterium]